MCYPSVEGTNSHDSHIGRMAEEQQMTGWFLLILSDGGSTRVQSRDELTLGCVLHKASKGGARACASSTIEILSSVVWRMHCGARPLAHTTTI